MTLIKHRLQSGDLKLFSFNFTSVREAYVRFSVRTFILWITIFEYAYLRNYHKINFRMVSAQHFINEAPDLQISFCIQPFLSSDSSVIDSSLFLSLISLSNSFTKWSQQWCFQSSVEAGLLIIYLFKDIYHKSDQTLFSFITKGGPQWGANFSFLLSGLA